VPALNRLHKGYGDHAAFYVVYIQEAHPIDGWQMDSNVKDDVLYASTHTSEDRIKVAGSCVKNLGIEFPAIVDDPDDHVEKTYTGWPDRLYVIDRDGRIAYKSQAGPFGFEPSGVESTLKRLLPDVVVPPEEKTETKGT
jgi:iodothyronine deiodinase-like protein